MFILSSDKTLVLEVEKDSISKPEILASQIEIANNAILLKKIAPNVVFTDKRYISNKFLELAVFCTEKGFFVTAFLPDENKTLNAFLGQQVDPVEACRWLRIEEIMGKDVLLVSKP